MHATESFDHGGCFYVPLIGPGEAVRYSLVSYKTGTLGNKLHQHAAQTEKSLHHFSFIFDIDLRSRGLRCRRGKEKGNILPVFLSDLNTPSATYSTPATNSRE